MVNLQEILKKVSKLLASEPPQGNVPLTKREDIWVGNRDEVQGILGTANEAADYTGHLFHLSKGVSKIIPLDEDSSRWTVHLEMNKFGPGEVRPVEIHRKQIHHNFAVAEEVFCYLLATNGLPQVFFVSPIDERSYRNWMTLVHPHEAIAEAATNHPRE